VESQRRLFVNLDRMRREMDELFGDVWGRAGHAGRRQPGFSPRVDVYYCSPDEAGAHPKAVVKVDLPGISLGSVSLEIAGRELVVSGERPVQETEGRVYQQVEIEAGPFRRVVQLGADVDAEAAKATYEDGILRVELPLRQAQRKPRKVPIENRE
jgi:HSP20 family protein